METSTERPKAPVPSARPSARPKTGLSSEAAVPPRYGYFLDGWRETSRPASEEFTLA